MFLFELAVSIGRWQHLPDLTHFALLKTVSEELFALICTFSCHCTCVWTSTPKLVFFSFSVQYRIFRRGTHTQFMVWVQSTSYFLYWSQSRFLSAANRSCPHSPHSGKVGCYFHCIHGPLNRYAELRDAHALWMPGTFPNHRELVIPTCITARVSPTCRGACRDRKLAFSFEFDGGENLAGIPDACATRNLTYLLRGPRMRWKYQHPAPSKEHSNTYSAPFHLFRA